MCRTQRRRAEEAGGAIESAEGAGSQVCGPVGGVVEDLRDELGGEMEVGGEEGACEVDRGRGGAVCSGLWWMGGGRRGGVDVHCVWVY